MIKAHYLTCEHVHVHTSINSNAKQFYQACLLLLSIAIYEITERLKNAREFCTEKNFIDNQFLIVVFGLDSMQY